MLTVFVPTLPSKFSAQTWNPTTQVPSIAVAKVGERDVALYDADGKEEIIPAGRIPATPVIVVKQNERLVVGTATNPLARSISMPTTLRTSSFSFNFKDKSFDGIQPTTTKSATTNRLAVNAADNRPTARIDTRNIEAFYSGVEWQRDYVYYGITPTITKGALKRNYRETIRSMKFSPDAFTKMSD